MKKIFSLFVGCMCTMMLSATVIFTENFEYSTGNLEGQGTWANSTNSSYQGFESPVVVDEDLQYPCYGGSVTSGKVVALSKDATADRVTYTSFSKGYGPSTSNATNVVYAAFLLKVEETTTSVRDFISFESSTGTTQRARLFVRGDGTGKFKLAITHNESVDNSTADWMTGLSMSETHLVVLKYEFVEGDNNDVVSLYVDFPASAAESDVTLTKSYTNTATGTNKDYTQVKGISLKQRSGASALKIGHIRVATTWEEAIDYQLPGMLVDENFNGGIPGSPWDISSNVATSTNSHDGSGKSLKFQYDESGVNTFTIITPAVNTADELSFWMKKNSTKAQVASVTIQKQVGSSPAEELAQYANGDITTDWQEFVVSVHELSNNVKLVITVVMIAPTEGTPFLMIDDMQLTSLEAVEVWDNADNTAVLTANKSKTASPKTVNVLMHRNLVVGTFNTICLPFALNTTEEMISYFGAGVEVKRLNMVEEREDGGYDLKFSNATKMAAGQPFLIKPMEDITTPILFRNVQITKTGNADVTGNYQPTGEGTGADLVKFQGVVNPLNFASEDQNSLILGEENTLYYVTGGTMKGFRGYFVVQGESAPLSSRFRVVMQQDVVTDAEEILPEKMAEKQIVNGQLVIIRDGKIFNAQGQLIK